MQSSKTPAKTVNNADNLIIAENWAERHRPLDLDDIVGQPTTVNMISGMLKRGEIPQSILITGDPGLGKTTIARIIARLINNLDKNTNYHPDLMEVNIASERGIADMRDLVASLKFLPTEAKFRVFILDEIQGLTPQAASSFLVPFESPPDHCVLIACSNEVEKIKETVRRRALILHLDRPEPSVLIPMLVRICKKEKIFIPTKQYKAIFKKIAVAAGGQPAMAIQLLQSIAMLHIASPITDVDKAITNIFKTLGLVSDKLAIMTLLGAYSGNIKRTVQSVGETTDFQSLTNQMLDLNSYVVSNTVQSKTYYSYPRGILAKQMTKFNLNPSFGLTVTIHAKLLYLRKELLLSAQPPYHVMLAGLSEIAILCYESVKRENLTKQK